ncbi:MAG: 6-phosphogluconolactonase [Patescibacteria group bacterium]
MELNRYATQEETQKAATAALNELLRTRSGLPTLFLGVGGSSLALLDGVDLALVGPHLMFGLADDRFSPDPKVNNFSSAKAGAWYPKWVEAGVGIIDSTVSGGESLQAFATRIESAIKKWREDHPDGMIIMTQGVGPDGHTQGIMPFPENPARFNELFLNTERWYTDYDATGKNPHPLRGTVTASFLRTEVAESIVYMTGEAKRDALERILSSEGTLAETPARIIREMPAVTIYTDIR